MHTQTSFYRKNKIGVNAYVANKTIIKLNFNSLKKLIICVMGHLYTLFFN